ncbi:sodium channel protein Nach-like isoform X2 [Frankliniella occidentalis]|uniref:Sodium channel protein Nach-like isoform X2 n=1 Tax=Frankliniella occidentalis TaxID=133901 RepID=A0A9C6X0G5_FRAOC|nr:sodium channel protein Nach-like isoform X2 [Frankliniella occidentalis]
MARSRRDVIAQVVADYMQQTSLHGYRYLTEPGRHWFERLLWLVVHALATGGVVWQVNTMYHEYRTQVPITTVQSTHYHVSLVPFPAVAICDINKIRKSRVQALAAKLIREHGLASVTQEELTGLLRFLGRLYDHSREGEEYIMRLEELFITYNVTLDYRGVMQMLGTQCDELLLACRWAGKAKPCTELFETRKTMEGYCCTFNYVRPTDNFDTSYDETGEVVAEDAQRSLADGPMMGLSVLVNSNISDYFYPLLPTTGVKLLVFNPNDYPDTASGGLIEKLVMAQEEVFFTLSSVTTKPTAEVVGLSKERRGCLFNNEKILFSNFYSYSDCLMDCRVQSMRNLCGCLPFYSPVKGKEEDTRVCEIGDLRCLNKHTEMWQTLRPRQDLPGLELEMTQSLECNECFPACGDTVYHVETTSMPLQQVLMDHSNFLRGFKVENHSAFHIYFGSTSQSLMNKSVRMAWPDLLSNVGGICGVFVGFSAMSVIEFLYFFTLRVFVALSSRRRMSLGRAAVAGSVGFQGFTPAPLTGHKPAAAARAGPPAPRYPKELLSAGVVLTPTTAPADGGHFSWGRYSFHSQPQSHQAQQHGPRRY